MADAKKGDLVQIHKIILEPDQRPDNLPSCTKSVPYECWIKGFFLDDEARIGDTVRVETLIGRELLGTLVEVNPIYDHNFGKPQRDLLYVSIKAKKQIEIEKRSRHGE